MIKITLTMQLSLRARHEGRQIIEFLVLFGSIALIWVGCMGWNGRSLICGHDSLLEAQYYSEVLRVRGNWADLLYTPKIFGGTALHGLFGTSFFNQVMAFIGVPSTTAYNFTHLLIQTLFGYLGTDIALSLARKWFKENASLSALMRWLIAIVIAFQPSLGWRLGWGHQNLVSAVLTMLAVFCLLTRERADSRVVLLLIWLALAQGATALGQQLNVYFALFVFPVLALFAVRHFRTDWATTGLVMLSVFLWVLPQNSEMLRLAIGSDVARSALRADVVYSYMVGTWNDLANLLLTSPTLLSDRTQAFQFHESHYYLGPFVLAAFALVRDKKLSVVFSVAIILLTAFALNFHPISTALLKAVPLLGGFRTPLRGFLLIAMLLTIFAMAAIAARARPLPSDRMNWVLGLVLIGLAWSVTAWSRELLAWAFGGFFLIAYRIPTLGRWFPVALAGTAALCLNAFQDKVVQGTDAETLSSEPAAWRARVLTQVPELDDPLNRALIRSTHRFYNANTGWAAGISTLDGYLSAPARLIKLLSQIENMPFGVTTALYKVSEKNPKLEQLRQLYNIAWALDFASNAVTPVTKLSPTMGRAWFARATQRLMTWEELLPALEQNGFRDKAFLVDEPGNRSLPDIAKSCESARTIDMVGGSGQDPVANVSYESPALCPLIISTNYISLFRARIEDGSELQTFPVDGTLTGILAPAGRHRLTLKAEAVFPSYARLICAALSLVAFFFAWKRAKNA